MPEKPGEFDPYQTMDCLTEGIVYYEGDGSISFCNKAAEQILGLSKKEILGSKATGQPWSAIREDGTPFPYNNQPAALTLNTGIPQTNVIMGIQKPAGNTFWIRMNSFPVKPANGNRTAVVTSLASITQPRQSAEEDRSQLQFNFDLVLENTEEAFVVTDRNLDVIFFNKAAKNMAWQINKSNLKTSVPLLAIISTEEARQQVECILPNILAGETRDFVRVYDFEDGNQSALQINYRPLYKDDCVQGIVVNTKDITETFLVEQELTKTNEELKKRASELTTSNEELEQFAYLASHDLQEPLRTVTSFLKLLKRRAVSLDDKSRTFIEFAEAGAERMKKLINDLLDFSRVTTRIDKPEMVNCRELIDQSMADLALLITEKQAKIIIGDLPFVKAVKSRLQQVFQNLLSNALKYHRDQAPEVEFGCVENQNTWDFFVRDNGIGIEKKDFERIFVIFQQLHERNKYQGTGIGLAIVKKIVEKHGGRISLESMPGKGSTFYFSLPK